MVSHEPTLFDTGLDDEVKVVSLYSDSEVGRMKGHTPPAFSRAWRSSRGLNFSILTELGCH